MWASLTLAPIIVSAKFFYCVRKLRQITFKVRIFFCSDQRDIPRVSVYEAQFIHEDVLIRFTGRFDVKSFTIRDCFPCTQNALYQDLLMYRNQIAHESGMAPFLVGTNKLLADLARVR